MPFGHQAQLVYHAEETLGTKQIHCAAHLLALLGWGRDLVACGILDCLRWI